MFNSNWILLTSIVTLVLLFHSTECQNTPVLTIPTGSLATISEDTSTGTSVYKCTATDGGAANTADGIIHYSIDPAVDGLFIDSSTCDVYVTPGLDYETNAILTGTITAEDQNGLKDVESFNFTVSDANDNAPKCNPLTIVGQVAEDTAVAGDVIATFACSDADQSDTVSSEVEFQVFPLSNAIEVNTTTGAAYLKRTVDFENDGSTITATVRVFDKGATQLTTTATVILQITDADDNIPTFDSASFSESVSEDISVGTTLTRVNASDLDGSSSNAEITFGLTSTCSPDVILLDIHTGDLILKTALDYETYRTVTCDILAYSSTKSSDTTNVTFTLTVNDVNDNSPVFNETFYTSSITENDIATTVVVQLSANDTDSGVNGQITYGMVDATDTFEIDASTGEVKVKTPPDYETASSYLLSVTAEDGGTPALTSSVYLQILVEPVNEFTPAFMDSTTIADISEDTVPGTSMHQVNITDSDSGDDGSISYNVLTTNVPFFVDSGGAIRVLEALDYETTTSYQFVVQAVDESSTTIKSATATYTVSILDADDNALSCDPVSTLALSGANNVGFVQATLNCSDLDTSAGSLAFSIVEGNDDNAWTVNAGGQVSLQTAPTQMQYDLSILVSDGSDSTNVNFTVFTETTLAFTNNVTLPTTIEENTSGSTLLTATACCVFGPITYSIKSGDVDNKVSIVSTSGELKHLLPYDRETTASYDYVIQAVSSSGQTASVTFTVTVSDANDNAPVYTQNVYEINVLETLAVSANIATYTATDADEGDNAALAYSIETGNGAGKFSLDASTGVLSLAGSLDYETAERYQLVLHAVDHGTPTNSTASTTVVITVENVDDQSPTILPLPGSYSLSLSEDVALGKSVFDVNAEDNDTDSSITFAIESGNTNNDFGIDTSDGYIYVANFLDRERTDTYTLKLTATDNTFSTTATGTLVVSIDDVNDNNPIFTPSVFEFDIAHDTGTGVSVGDIVVADDDTGTNAALTTTITSGNTGGAFTLTGLQLDTNITMDFTTISTYRLGVQTVDGGSPARSTTTIVVVNVLPDTSTPDYGSVTNSTVTLNEDVDVGYELIDVGATYLGAVEGDGSTLYSINSGNTGSKFSVRQQTGEVYVASALDYETTQTYTLVIRAQNSVTTANTADFTLTVNVENINEHDPVFDEISVTGQGSFSFDVDELSAAGTVVGSVSASDDDIEDPGTVTHALSGSTDFTIDPTTGSITVAGDLNYTDTSVYNLVVTATDAGTTARSESVSVVIRVVDVNNNSPVFTSTDTAQVLDSAATGSEFFHVHASDADTGDAGSVKYSIITDPSLGKISIDAETGVLTVTGQLDAALEASYVLTVQATDEGVPSLNTTQTLTVTVIATVPNYYDPAFATSPVSTSVARDAAVGTTIVAVSATDADSGDSGDVFHMIISGNSEGLFLIARSSGVITTASSVLDADNAYSLVVEARDKGVPYRSINVTVDIAVSPSKTTLITPDYIFTVAEDASVNDLVGEILVDTGRTTTSYTIDAGNYDTSFSISRDSGTGRGQLKVAKSLDFETFPLFALLVSVTTDIGTFTKIVDVQVTDVNDSPPIFDTNSLTLTLHENMPVGYTVTTLSPSDADNDTINRDNLLSLSNPGPDLFNIDQDGHLTIATMPDFETVGSQRIFDVVAADQQPPQTSATVTVTVNIVDVVEEEERRHSEITTNAMISLGCHYPASDGDVIWYLSAGDFGILESTNATVQYEAFSRPYPFSVSSSGEVTVTDAASLQYPERYIHWVLCRSSDAGVTTTRISILRIDTYHRDTHMAVIEFAESSETIREGMWTFIFRAQAFLPDTQRLGISLLLDTSTDTRRRLLATQTATFAYVIKDTSLDDMANIDQPKEFLTVDEILAIYQRNVDGTPIRGLSYSDISVSTVEPFGTGDDDDEFPTSTTGILVWVLLAIFLVSVIAVCIACAWWRSKRNSDWKPKKLPPREPSPTPFLTMEAEGPRPGSAPSDTALRPVKVPPTWTSIQRGQHGLPNRRAGLDNGKISHPVGLAEVVEAKMLTSKNI